jgi:hypothetical protein
LIFGRHLLTSRNDATGVTGRHPVDGIAWTDLVPLRDHFGVTWYLDVISAMAFATPLSIQQQELNPCSTLDG